MFTNVNNKKLRNRVTGSLSEKLSAENSVITGDKLVLFELLLLELLLSELPQEDRNIKLAMLKDSLLKFIFRFPLPFELIIYL